LKEGTVVVVAMSSSGHVSRIGVGLMVVMFDDGAAFAILQN